MVIFLVLGVVLGIVSVVFVLQNITPVTVSFLAWQMDGSLAVILFLAVLSGVFTTLLLLLPSFIRDEWHYSKLKKHAKNLEDELAKSQAAVFPADPVVAERTNTV